MVRIYVPDLPEMMPIVDGARAAGGCTILDPRAGYWRIEAEEEICFGRKALGLGPALWNSALTGGFHGKIVEYGRDVLRIRSAEDTPISRSC